MAVAKPTDSIVFFSLPLFAPEGDGNTALHRSIERKNRRSRARRRQPKNPQQRGAAERRENAAINSLPNGPQRDSNQQFHVPQMQFVVAKAVFLHHVVFFGSFNTLLQHSSQRMHETFVMNSYRLQERSTRCHAISMFFVMLRTINIANSSNE